jgi:hypothetical protein
LAPDYVHNILQGSPEQCEAPTDQAVLQIASTPLSITASGRGPVATSMALGVLGPAATITAGSFSGFPAWMVTAICFLQVVAACFPPRGGAGGRLTR